MLGRCRTVARMRLALPALAIALTIAGCSSPSTEGRSVPALGELCSTPPTEAKSVPALGELIKRQSIRSVPAHPQPGWQAHPSTRALVVRQHAPDCELPGLEPDTVDVDNLWSRLKLDYEQHCYRYKREAEAITGVGTMGDKVEGARAAVPGPVAPTDSGVVVQDTPAAPTVVGPLDSKFYQKKAIALYGNGDLALALIDFDKAIELDPSVEEAYIDRSVILYRLGILNLAFDDVARARRIENSHRIPTPPLPRASPLSNKN
jgi:tetratricopeptide (TPR) repeat protein